MNASPQPPTNFSPLDRARRKAYGRILPLLFVCYVIAYIDRINVSIAKLTMVRDLPGFDSAVFGFGSGIFFLGYFLLEIPGTLIIEKWSARKWICRIMLTWGLMAALTALVKTPFQFYSVRFLLGLAEAGFFPGVIVYLTHWFPNRDRTKALSYFLIATPFAQIISPKISNLLLKIGTSETVNGVILQHPKVWGLAGWQWVYIFWGLPAIVLGVVVLAMLKDNPRDAKWLSPEESSALEQELEREKNLRSSARRMGVLEALRHPKVLLLALAYFCSVTGSQAVEFFLPTILEKWYALKLNAITWLVILPPMLAVAGQLFVGWNSDRTKERRIHTAACIALAALALALTPLTRGNLAMTVAVFMVAALGFKAYLPSFWALPSLFLTEAAAAGSIGFINSVGNLGGFFGPSILGWVDKTTGSFTGGIYYLSISMLVSASIIFFLGVGKKER